MTRIIKEKTFLKDYSLYDVIIINYYFVKFLFQLQF
jgi:hypothetical protein